MSTPGAEHDVTLTTDELTTMLEILHAAVTEGRLAADKADLARDLVVKLERAHAMGLAGE